MNKLVILTSILTLGLLSSSRAQETLSKADAVSIALENNFDIRASNNDLEVAGNNASILNSGYLPMLAGNAGANYSVANSNLSFVGDSSASSITVNNIKTSSQNASLNMNYTLFDGMGRMYNYKILKNTYQLSEVATRMVMENTLINLFTSYYEIARLTENQGNQKESLDISHDRLKRAEYGFDYGQSTKLDVLNAEVDYNNDSINYLTITQQLKNQKRSLNLLMGRAVNTAFDVDTTLTFEELAYPELEQLAIDNNATVIQEKGSLQNAKYEIEVARASVIPKIGLNASYGFTRNIFPPGNNLSESQSLSTNVGATLTWNIFDGGKSNVQRQNSRLAYENQKISLEQAELTLETQIQNAWTVYQTALFVMQAEEKNLQTNQLNFDRSQEQYQLGQITSIEFRTAQQNLLAASLSYNQAKYSAKNAELALLQLSGTLLQASF